MCPHPPDLVLLRFAEDSIAAAAERERVGRHVAQCGRCRDIVRYTAAALAALRRAADGAEPPPAARPRRALGAPGRSAAPRGVKGDGLV